MRTTIRIDDDLYRRVKTRAAESGRSVAEIIEDAVRGAMLPRSTDRPPPIVLPVFGAGGVMPGVDLSSNAALRDVMDEDQPLDARR